SIAGAGLYARGDELPGKARRNRRGARAEREWKIYCLEVDCWCATAAFGTGAPEWCRDSSDGAADARAKDSDGAAGESTAVSCEGMGVRAAGQASVRKVVAI